MPDGGGRRREIEQAINDPERVEDGAVVEAQPLVSKEAVKVTPEADCKQVEQLCDALDGEDISGALAMTESIKNASPIIYDPSVQKAAKRAVYFSLRRKAPDLAEKLITRFGLHTEFYSDNEFEELVKSGIANEMFQFGGWNSYDAGKRIKYYKELLPDAVNDPLVQGEAMARLRSLVRAENFNACTELLTALPVPGAVGIPELQAHGEQMMKSDLYNFWEQKKASETAETYRIPEERIQAILDEQVRKNISIGNLTSVNTLRNRWGARMPKFEIYEPLIKEEYLKALRTSNFNLLEGLQSFSLDESFIHSPEAQAAGREGILYALKNFLTPQIDLMLSKFGLPESILKEPELQVALRQNIFRQVGDDKSNSPHFALKRAEIFGIALKGPFSEQEKENVVKALAYSISHQDNGLRDRLTDAFGASKEFVGAGAKGAVINFLTEGYGAHAVNTQTGYGLPVSIFEEPAVREAAKKGFAVMLRERRLDDSEKVRNLAVLDDEDVRRMVVHEIIKSVTEEYGAQRAADIARVYGDEVRDRLISVPEMQEAAFMGFRSALLKGWVEASNTIEETFNLPEEQCYEIAGEMFVRHLESGSSEVLGKIQRIYKIPNEVTWQPEVQVAAMKGLRKSLIEGRMVDAGNLAQIVPLWESAVQQITGESVIQCLEKGEVDKAILVKNFQSDLSSADNYAPDFGSVSGNIPFSALIKIQDIKDFEVIYQRDAWHGAMEQLLKLQARAANAEHDPWLKDMNPLVTTLVQDGAVDRKKPEDGELLVEFVKNFGMYNLPKMTKVFIELKRGAKFDQLADETKEQLRTVIGKRAERMTGEQLINELRQFQRGMQGQLLSDDIPKGIETGFGEEIFSGIKGATKWGRSDAISDIVALQRQRRAEVSTVEAPVEMRERTFQIPLVTREKPAETKESRDKKSALLARKNGDKRTELGVFFDLLEGANADSSAMVKSTDVWWEAHRTELIAKMTLDPDTLETALAEREEELRAKGNPPEKIEKILNGVRSGFEKKRQQVADKQAKLHGLEYPQATGDKEADDKAMVAAMEAIAVVGGVGGMERKVLLALSAEHIRRLDPQWSERFARAVEVGGAAVTGERLAELEGFYVQYLTEHYLNRTAGQDHTGHAKFSDTLLDVLESSWAVGKELQKHVLVQKKREFDEMTSGNREVSKETIAVTRVRSKGLLLTYSGDVGDACYTSKHKELAQGDFPGIEAEIFVTNRGTAQERLQGSALHVETSTPKGERVLMLRANNPRENLITQVDAEAFIKMTIDDAIDKAKELGMDMVVVPFDKATASCSNRSAVAEYYRKHYDKAPKVELINEPGTNFNGYDNWNAKGEHPVVVVWRKGQK